MYMLQTRIDISYLVFKLFDFDILIRYVHHLFICIVSTW